MTSHISRTRTIAAGPQETWDVLADFGGISSWAADVDHSCVLEHGPEGGPIGTTRRVQLKRNTVVERIVEFVPESALAYDVLGLPRILGSLRNRWTLTPSAGATEVTLTSTVNMGDRPPQRLAERAICRVAAKQSDALLAGLAKRLENHHV